MSGYRSRAMGGNQWRISSFDVEIQEESFKSFVRSISRVSGTTSFSGESCNAQFSAPHSQMNVLTVNITL